MRSLRTRIPNTSPEGPNPINPLTPRDTNGKRNKIRRKSEDMFYSSDDLVRTERKRERYRNNDLFLNISLYCVE